MQDSQPRLSVVLPVFRVPQYLPGCLDSVLACPGAGLEVIAVDDASPDDCGQILDAHAAADSRLKVIHLNRNGGPGHARNTGLDAATGDYVWFTDSDDLVTDGAVEAITARLAAHRPDLLLIDYEYLYPGGRTAPSFSHALLRAVPDGPFPLASQPQLIDLTMTSWSKVISRPFLAGLGVRFGSGIHEDVLLSCAALLAADRISVLARPCYRYRIARPGSFMTAASSGNMAIFDAYRQVFDFVAKREAAAGLPLPATLRTALFERAIWHYSTVLQAGGLRLGPVGGSGLVPPGERREFFARMHADFERYAPPGYRFPRGARGAKFRLIARDAYWAYELLEPLNKMRVAVRGRVGDR